MPRWASSCSDGQLYRGLGAQIAQYHRISDDVFQVIFSERHFLVSMLLLIGGSVAARCYLVAHMISHAPLTQTIHGQGAFT